MIMRSPTSVSSHSRDDQGHFALDNIDSISGLFLSHISKPVVLMPSVLTGVYDTRPIAACFVPELENFHVFSP